MASKLSFSYSKMGMYKECPQKYKFRYIDKLPEKPKYYFAFGSALHRVMEHLYSKNGVFPPLAETLKFFDADWRATTFAEKGYASKEKQDEGRLEAIRIINEYYKKHSADNLIPLATEFRTTVDIDGLSVISILDRVDYLGEGKISILDYKTGKTLSREPDQLMMYQKLMDGNPQLASLIQAKDLSAKEIKLDSMLFYHLPTLKEQSFSPASKEEIDSFWQGVLKVAADIMAGSFAPDPDETKCRFCDYKPFCPVWNLSESQQQEAQAPKEETLNPQQLLTAKIDELGQTQEKAEKLKAEIIKIMRENGYNRHFGMNYLAALTTKTEFDFTDRQKTVDVLRELNLLPKVLVPTLSSIKALLEGGTLTPQQKEKLDALAQKKEIIDLTCSKTED